MDNFSFIAYFEGLDNFSLIANLIGLFYHNLKKFDNLSNENAIFGAVYLDLTEYIKQKRITVIDIKNSFELASKGICRLDDFEIKHSSEASIEKNEFDFILNLTLQIQALIFKSEHPEFSNEDLISNIIERKDHIRNVLILSTMGYDYYPNHIMEFSKGIMARVKEIIHEKSIMTIIREFRFLPIEKHESNNANPNQSQKKENVQDQIISLYDEIYSRSLELRISQFNLISKNAEKHIEEIRDKVNIDVVFSNLKKEEKELKAELQKLQEETKVKHLLIDELKRRLNYYQEEEIKSYESKLVAIMEAQMDKEIPKLKELEKLIKRTVSKYNENATRKRTIVFIILGIISGIIIASLI